LIFFFLDPRFHSEDASFVHCLGLDQNARPIFLLAF
jgi:hypothetical protein